jgi:hypothetical protein
LGLNPSQPPGRLKTAVIAPSSFIPDYLAIPDDFTKLPGKIGISPTFSHIKSIHTICGSRISNFRLVANISNLRPQRSQATHFAISMDVRSDQMRWHKYVIIK